MYPGKKYKTLLHLKKFQSTGLIFFKNISSRLQKCSLILRDSFFHFGFVVQQGNRDNVFFQGKIHYKVYLLSDLDERAAIHFFYLIQYLILSLSNFTNANISIS